MRTNLSEHQAKASERRKAFSALWKRVAAMPEDQRIAMANKLGFRTVTGHPLSLGNTMLLAMQCPTGSVFGGFRQWKSNGRSVKKGEHGQMIWVPTGGRKQTEESESESDDGGSDCRFVVGTVFDISQTEVAQ